MSYRELRIVILGSLGILSPLIAVLSCNYNDMEKNKKIKAIYKHRYEVVLKSEDDEDGGEVIKKFEVVENE